MSHQTILKQFKPEQHNLLEILHALQDSHPQNYLTEDALEETARYLKITKSSVYGVAGYYSMFSLKPRGKFIIRVCVSPVCELLKSDEVLPVLHKELGIKPGETTPCGLFTLEVSECLGQCQEAPSMMINQEVYNELTENKITDVLNKYRETGKQD
jgi:NADH-quinone oxidoreductase subunit E